MMSKNLWRYLLTAFFFTTAFFLPTCLLYILYPSYLSVQSVCGVLNNTQIKGYIQGGEYNPINDTISLKVMSLGVYRHELCHQSQKKAGKSFDCKHKVKLFAYEVEAYISEYTFWNC